VPVPNVRGGAGLTEKFLLGRLGWTRSDQEWRSASLQAVLDSIAQMAPEDRALAERVHVTVTATALELAPNTWYGMPAHANAGDLVLALALAGAASGSAAGRQLPSLSELRKARSEAGSVKTWPVIPSFSAPRTFDSRLSTNTASAAVMPRSASTWW
jgi:hypothetical protein